MKKLVSYSFWAYVVVYLGTYIVLLSSIMFGPLYQDEPATVLLTFFGPILILGFLSTVSLVLSILFIIHAAKREFASKNEKILWIIVLVVGGLIGQIVYFLMRYIKKIKVRNNA